MKRLISQKLVRSVWMPAPWLSWRLALALIPVVILFMGPATNAENYDS